MIAVAAPWARAAKLVPARADETPATSTDLRLPSAQNSPLLAVDPRNPRFVVLAHRQDAPEFGCGLQVSGDGGQSWIPTQPVPELPPGAERCYAPEIVFDNQGTLYYLFIGLQGRGNNPMGVFLTSSRDNGRTFSPPRLLLGPSNYQVRMAIDRSIGKRGRIHLVWLHAASDAPLGGLPPEANPIFTAFSDNGGRTFSSPVQVSDPSRARVVAPAVTIGRDHAVHIAYYDLLDDAIDYQGLEGPPWTGRWSLVATSSTDGGRHFRPGVVVDDSLIPPGRVMLVYTMPPPSLVADRAGTLYLAWWDSRNGDPDIFLSRSVEEGRRWEPARRVNDDVVGNHRDQYLVRLGVAPTGRLDAVFFDRREDPANLRNNVFYTFSEDGGRSFAPNVKLTSESSDSRIGQRYLVPSAAGLVEVGGRLGLLSRRASAVAAWPDMRNAVLGSSQQDVFTSEVRFPGVGEEGGGSFVGRVLLAGGVIVALGVFVLILTLRRRSRRTSAPLA